MPFKVKAIMSIREDFILSLNISKLRIENFPGFVFLFGGKAFEEEQNAAGEVPASMRGMLYREILVKYRNIYDRLIIPETFKDWLNDAIYNNLIDFELDLAELSSVVAIVTEAPGAIAELGAFCMVPDLQNKIIVISNEYFVREDSFLNLGPYRYQSRKFEDSIYRFQWPFTVSRATNIPPVISINHAELQESCSLAALGLSEFISSRTRSSISFDPQSAGNMMLFAADLIRIFGALKITEIYTYLSVFSDKIKKPRVGQFLFVLEKLEIIRPVHSGNTKYYVAGAKSQVFIKYAYSEKFMASDEILSVLVKDYEREDTFRLNAVLAKP